MKSAVTALVIGLCCSAVAQGTFQNLDFESATPGPPLGPPPIGGIPGVSYQPVNLALPGWTAYIANEQQTEVIQNSYGHGQAQIDLFGPNYPAAYQSPGLTPGTIDGNYSVLLQSGADPANVGALVGASIAQTATVPFGTDLLEFRAWQTASTDFTVSFNGSTLSPFVISTASNYQLYGADISSYAGQTGQLEFTCNYNFSGGASWLGLDDIAFSPVPEPNPLILAGIGGILFALYRQFLPKRRRTR